MALYKHLTDEQRLALTPHDWHILDQAKALDERFEKQFERRYFDYVRPKEDVDYLPPELSHDRHLVKDRTVRLSYTYWPAKNGDKNAKTVICLPGIYQGARHGDLFAEQASATANIVCLDYPGKGHSGNLYLPEDYRLRTYAKMTAALVDDLNPKAAFSIIGHSHGAKIIYTMVEQGYAHPKWESAILGDMGPEAPDKVKAARTWHPRGASKYASITDALEGLRRFSRSHGALPRDYYINAMNHSFSYHSRAGDSRYAWNHDANSMVGYCDEYAGPYDKWDAYKKIPVHVLLMVGEKSDTVDPPLLQRMIEERPDTSVLLFRNAGHYPELFMADHIRHVMDWVNKQKPGITHLRVRLELPAAEEDDRNATPLQIETPAPPPVVQKLRPLRRPSRKTPRAS